MVAMAEVDKFNRLSASDTPSDECPWSFSPYEFGGVSPLLSIAPTPRTEANPITTEDILKYVSEKLGGCQDNCGEICSCSHDQGGIDLLPMSRTQRRTANFSGRRKANRRVKLRQQNITKEPTKCVRPQVAAKYDQPCKI